MAEPQPRFRSAIVSAYRAGREAAARDIEADAKRYEHSELAGYVYDYLLVAARTARGESGDHNPDAVPLPAEEIE